MRVHNMKLKNATRIHSFVQLLAYLQNPHNMVTVDFMAMDTKEHYSKKEEQNKKGNKKGNKKSVKNQQLKKEGKPHRIIDTCLFYIILLIE